MDIEDSPEEAEFRARIRDFLTENRARLAPAGTMPEGRVEEFKHTQAVLADAGLVGATWPVEHGGRGASAIQQVIIDQELRRAGVPRVINWIGLGMCGPAILAHGTDAQRERYLRPLLRADEVWCQLFSEPGAGSDLAAVATKAVRDGDGWRVTGQKVWTTGAQWCDFGILLARTDPDVPKHRGLTMFLVDMKAPGVSVRPLREMTGKALFNEVFFDDVLVPDGDRVGEVGQGWSVALTVLMNERFTVAGDGSVYGAGPDALAEAVRRRLPQLADDRRPGVLQEFASCWVEALACRMTGNRMLTAIAQGRQPGPEGSTGKLAAAQLLARVADLGLRMQGDDALFGASVDGDTKWQYVATFAHGAALAGGTTEIMKNILGERVLGLPQEPRPDKAPATAKARA